MYRSFSRLLLVMSFLVLAGQGCLQLGGSNQQTTTGPGGFFISEDKGETWQQASAYPSLDGVQQLTGVSVWRLNVDPQDRNALYWATRGNGLFYSYNAGRSWQWAAAPLQSGFIYDVKVDPTDKCTIYATNGFQILKSDDCSRSWTEIHKEDRAAARISTLTVADIEGTPIFAGKQNGEMMRSDDGGINWRATIFRGVQFVTVRQDGVNKQVLYASTRKHGLFRSDDGGQTWRRRVESLDSFAGALEYRGFYVDENVEGHLYWISDYGILESRDKGETWESIQLITPPGTVDIYGFTADPSNDTDLYYTTFDGVRSTLYRSEDHGVTWQTERLPSGQVPSLLYMNQSGRLYIGFTIPPQE